MWGSVKAPLGSSVVPKAFLCGHFWMGERARNSFSRAWFFSLDPRQLGIYLGLLRKSEPGGSRCMWGCVKAPLGSSLVPKAFLWGHLWMRERGSQRVSWGPIFQSSSMSARVILRLARKQRTRKVQLHVGLRKASPGEITCTQSLPLQALLDGRKRLAMRFLRPAFPVFSVCG